jgi:hypothetical protein
MIYWKNGCRWHQTLKRFSITEEIMKKLLVPVLLTFIVAGGVFAQVTVSGGVQVDFGANVDTVNDGHTWIFDGTSNGTNIKVSAEGDGVKAFVKFGAGSGFHSADATVDISSAQLSIGYAELPWAQWSSLNFLGDSNWAFGSSASDKNAYIQFGAAGFYIGISDASNINDRSPKDWKTPGFYLGYEFAKEDSFSAGAAFAGTLRGENKDAGNGISEDGTFPFMLNAHAKFLADPLTLGINVGFYGAPQNGFFSITRDAAAPIICSTVYGLPTGVNGDKAKILEAMLDVGIALDPCSIGITGALVMNLADKEDGGQGQALKLGASADFNLGGGFTFTPGLIYTTILKGPGDSDYDYGNLAIGATFSYSF